jgi:hypothetical protein
MADRHAQLAVRVLIQAAGIRDRLVACSSTTSRHVGETEAIAQARFAREDLEDIVRSSILIAFTEEPRTVLTCGGRHFEAGYAHSRGAKILIVGPRENIFYQLADAWFETWEACIASLDQSAIRRSA